MLGRGIDLGTLTIASGQTNSDVLDLDQFEHIRGIVIAGPATLPETVTVEVSLDGGASWVAYQSGGSDITIPAAKGVPITFLVADQLRLTAGAGVAADRAFQVQGLSEL